MRSTETERAHAGQGYSPIAKKLPQKMGQLLLYIPLFRFPQPLHNAELFRLVIHNFRDSPAKQRKHRNGCQHRRYYKVRREEPEHPFQHPSRQGIHNKGQHQGNEGRAQRIEQPLLNQHGLQLLPRHANGLQYRKLPLPG